MSPRWPIVSTLVGAAAVVTMIGLGVWQLQRKVWKENLIAAMTSRLDAPAQPLPSQWVALTQDADEFRRVAFTATFAAGEEALVYTPGSALRSDIKGPGYFVFAPARLADSLTCEPPTPVLALSSPEAPTTRVAPSPDSASESPKWSRDSVFDPLRYACCVHVVPVRVNT